MSDLGYSPAPPSPPPPPARGSSDIPMWMVGVAVLVALGLAGALGFAIVSQVRTTGGHEATAPKRSYPATWDRRIAPYAKIAEHERGLRFLHPVAVRFLPPARFEKSVTSDQDKLTRKDHVDLEHFTGLMRAFGLISGNVDLFKAFNDFSGGAILAYYSFKDKRVTVRGHEVTPAVRSTLVHELTHALQDQHFHVGARLKQLQKQAKDGSTDSASSVLDAIVEGDAERVQGLYRDSLSTKQRDALDRSQQSEATEADKRLQQVPKVVIAMQTSPYTLGEGLVQTVAANGGNAAVDRLLRKSPTHETALLDPFRVLNGDTGSAHVARPKLLAAEKKFDSGELGVLTWYLMLAQRLPLQQALAAADGWGGDAYVAYTHAGDTCARMTYAGRSPADTARMDSALQAWVAAGPGSVASVDRVGNEVRFQSCDPGAAAQVGTDDSQEAIGLVSTRTQIGDAVMRSGASHTQARCLAGRLVETYTLSQLNDPTFGANDPTVQGRIQQMAADCR